MGGVNKNPNIRKIGGHNNVSGYGNFFGEKWQNTALNMHENEESRQEVLKMIIQSYTVKLGR